MHQGGMKISIKKSRYYASPEIQASPSCKQVAMHCSKWRSSSTVSYLWLILSQPNWGGVHERR